jgi:pectin methylesterase-like acyl-CoA thioesterase
MYRIRKTSFALLAIASLFVFWGIFQLNNTAVKGKTISVPSDYATIQSGIDAASDGDMIHVEAGRYYESVRVNKSVSIVGDSVATTSIYCTSETYDPYSNFGNPFDILADNVLISNFAILDANDYYGAIKASSCQNLNIKNNVFSQGHPAA